MARWLGLAEMSKLKARRDFYFTPVLETTAVIENPLNHAATFEYEILD
jgi:hypothetical protein